jgi:hypothetical protein
MFLVLNMQWKRGLGFKLSLMLFIQKSTQCYGKMCRTFIGTS